MRRQFCLSKAQNGKRLYSLYIFYMVRSLFAIEYSYFIFIYSFAPLRILHFSAPHLQFVFQKCLVAGYYKRCLLPVSK